MRWWIGVLIIVVGILSALYVGVYLLFIGGIMQIVAGVQVDPVCGADIAWGTVRIILASPIGTVIGVVFFAVGGVLAMIK